MKRMLLNATHAEEMRVAIVDGQTLVDVDIESAVRSARKGNIYKGIVKKVEPSLEACFIEYGAERQGFLSKKDIYRGYFSNYEPGIEFSDIKIGEEIQQGQELIVQVQKDERSNKGAALTTFINLAGRFMVFMPNNPKGNRISRNIDGAARTEIKEIISTLNMDKLHSLIIRTEALGRTREELQWDLDFLARLWENIEQAANASSGPFLIYQESNLIVRSMRDHLSKNISEIITDDEEVFERAGRFMKQVAPDNKAQLKLYTDSTPLFSRYQIEGQIRSAFDREVKLSSGGSVVIDHTEALTAIDVNSRKATKGTDMEETALQTNLEAVEEIARQLRFRDLGGLVVMDLIDMENLENRRTVETRLKKFLRVDRARVQVGQISEFGLLEMSRQRIRSSITDISYRTCPRCNGVGSVRSVVSATIDLLRSIEEESIKPQTEGIRAQVPLDMFTYLFNEKRHEMLELESRLGKPVTIIPSKTLDNPLVERIKSDELDRISGVFSYQQDIQPEPQAPDKRPRPSSKPAEQARVHPDQIEHTPLPRPGNGTSGSFIGNLLARISGLFVRSDKQQKPSGQNRRRGSPKPTGSQNRKPKQGGRKRGSGGQRAASAPGSRERKPAGTKKPGQKTSRSGKRPEQGNRKPDDNKARHQQRKGQAHKQGDGRQPPGKQPRNQSADKSEPDKRRPAESAQVAHSHLDVPADIPDDIGNRK